MNPLKIVFMGTPCFAVPSLKALCDAGFVPSLVVCQPDKPQGRGLKTKACSVKAAALDLGLEVYQPKSLKTAQAQAPIADLQPDLIVVVAYGKILPDELLSVPKMDILNIHPSLLPQYRGPSPIHTPLLNGDSVTGVTIMRVTHDVDAGDIFIQEEVPIGSEDCLETMHDRLSDRGAQLLVQVTQHFAEHGAHDSEPQDHSAATFTQKIDKAMCQINWNQSAQSIASQVRALSPHPGAFTFFEGQVLKVFKLTVESLDKSGEAPGTVVKTCSKEGLFVACGEGSVCLKEVQAEGKKRMAAQAYICGHGQCAGVLLG